MGLYFRLEARNRACDPFTSVDFTENQTYHDLGKSPWDWKICSKLLEIDPNFGQNHPARKAVSATFQVLWRSGAIFRPRSSKPSVPSFYLCSFDRIPRPLEVSFESMRLGNIPQVAGDWPKVGQNHDARKAVSATLSVLKKVGLYFGLEVRNWAFKNFSPIHFTENHGHHALG